MKATVDKTNTREREVINEGLFIISRPIVAKFVEPLKPYRKEEPYRYTAAAAEPTRRYFKAASELLGSLLRYPESK